MPRIVRSARGELVDFDLINIKQQIADTPQPTIVKTRQDFIEQRLNRKNKAQMDAAIEIIDEPTAEEPVVEEDIKPTKQKARNS